MVSYRTATTCRLVKCGLFVCLLCAYGRHAILATTWECRRHFFLTPVHYTVQPFVCYHRRLCQDSDKAMGTVSHTRSNQASVMPRYHASLLFIDSGAPGLERRVPALYSPLQTLYSNGVCFKRDARRHRDQTASGPGRRHHLTGSPGKIRLHRDSTEAWPPCWNGTTGTMMRSSAWVLAVCWTGIWLVVWGFFFGERPKSLSV